MKPDAVISEIQQLWPQQVQVRTGIPWSHAELRPAPELLAALCDRLFNTWHYAFATLVVEETDTAFELRYLFYSQTGGRLTLVLPTPLNEPLVPSISRPVHAADWHEREAEDLFELSFSGHPQLGDFVLHDDAWQEGVAPMRRDFDAGRIMAGRQPQKDWRPHRIVHEHGAFVMPIGPVFGAANESVHFLLETVGEDVIRSTVRLFYKWRAVEKTAEGQDPQRVVLLAERFAATTAFAHGLAYCQAFEAIAGIAPPARALLLRVFLAELERLRHHVGAIAEICESTALLVATSQAQILEEDLLRCSCELSGHRYLFGVLAPGGLCRDVGRDSCQRALSQARNSVAELNRIEELLRLSSSFLDRLEEVGRISQADAGTFGLVGPVARASGVARDLRTVQTYSGYRGLEFQVPVEIEGDGYARLRVLFAEARQALVLMEQCVQSMRPGDWRVPCPARGGAAFGWVEAPRGAAFHWLRLDGQGRVQRYHIAPPSFANWHGFHLAAEKFAFQDFPIILASFDLSVAESDR